MIVICMICVSRGKCMFIYVGELMLKHEYKDMVLLFDKR